SPGIHTLYIKDKGGCGIQEYQFSILAYPKFFTPNGDGENDLWQINGFDKSFYTKSNIYIYNRFGNLLYTIEQNSQGWDGNFGGKKMPSNTYWFRVVLTDINGYSIEKFGNISLIR
ncbi:T9SS type B sorting domain-containing protein, partial [Polaribacter sp.]